MPNRKLIILCSLFFIANSGLVVNKVLTEPSLDNAPCEESGVSTPSAAMTTTQSTTTSNDPGCPQTWHIPFKRKNGWWCTGFTLFEPRAGTEPMGKKFASVNCEANNLTLSSLETEEEWAYWIDYVKRIGYISGVWLAIGRNGTNGTYYWNDGQALPEIKYGPISTVVKGGEVAWVVDKNSTTAPFGRLDGVRSDGDNTPVINSGICGAPGRQFN